MGGIQLPKLNVGGSIPPARSKLFKHLSVHFVDRFERVGRQLGVFAPVSFFQAICVEP